MGINITYFHISEATKREWETAQVRTFTEKGNRACDNGENNSDQKIYAYMERISVNDKFPGGNFGDRS